MIYKCANAYYFRHLNKIGGIESHLYYIARKYGDYDITVFYRTGDKTQIDRLKKYVRCIELYDKDYIVCKKMFCCFNRDVLKQCQADEKILVLHGDYKNMVERGQLSRANLPLDSRIDRYIGVSQLVCDSWEEITGVKAENVYQPLVLDKVDKPLMFISATRLTSEKGFERMKKLAETLDNANVNYMWFVYTDSQVSGTKNMVMCKPRLDISDKLGGFDAFIQLSDNEGFCLSIVESLMRGTPIIATKLPVLKELGLDENNSILLDFDMLDIPVDKIKNIYKMKFDYKPPKDKWNDVLDHTPKRQEEIIEVMALDDWKSRGIVDTQHNRIPPKGMKWFVSESRYEEIKGFEEHSRLRLIKRV